MDWTVYGCSLIPFQSGNSRQVLRSHAFCLILCPLFCVPFGKRVQK